MKSFYNLVESNAMRQHCEKTKYELDAVDCVYLVWDNKNISIQEKHNLYNEIMKEREDCNIIEYDDSKVSFFNMLKEHMELETNMLKIFKSDADKKIYERGFRVGKLKTIRKNYSGYVTNLEKGLDAYFENGKITMIDTDSWINTFFVVSYTISLPVPFERGDIIQCFDLISNYSPCIFDCICDEYDDENDEEDNSWAYVYTIYSDGEVERVLAKCSKMDFFTDKLPENKKLYQALSDCIKGKISPAALMNIQCRYLVNNKKCKFNLLDTHLTDKEYNYILNLFSTDK